LGTGVYALSEPGKLAVSDDGSMLYAASRSTNSIQPFDLPTMTAGTSFLMGPDGWRTADMDVIPGNPQALAVVRRDTDGSPYDQGAAIFVDGEKLPIDTHQLNPPYSAMVERLATANTDDVAYIYDGALSPHTKFGTMNIDLGPEGGIWLDHSTAGLLSSAGESDLQYDGGRVYSASGQVIDPDTHTKLGSYGLPFGGASFVSDSRADRIYFQYEGKINVFHQPTFAPIHGEAIDIPGFNGTGGDLIRCGPQTMAFRTDDKVYLVDSTSIIVPEPAVFNGDFSDGLLHWTATGPGDAAADTVGGLPAAVLTAGSEIVLGQSIDTPDEPFLLEFDYRFEQSDGQLAVELAGMQLALLDAADSPVGEFRHAGIGIYDPDVLGLFSMPLQFTFNGATDSQAAVTNVAMGEVPEPGTLVLLLMGLGALVLIKRRR